MTPSNLFGMFDGAVGTIVEARIWDVKDHGLRNGLGNRLEDAACSACLYAVFPRISCQDEVFCDALQL